MVLWLSPSSFDDLIKILGLVAAFTSVLFPRKLCKNRVIFSVVSLLYSLWFLAIFRNLMLDERIPIFSPLFMFIVLIFFYELWFVSKTDKSKTTISD